MEQPSPANNTGDNNTATSAATNNPNTPINPSDQHAANTNSSNPNTSTISNPSSQSSNQPKKPPPSGSRKGRKGSTEKAWIEKFKMLEEFYAINGHSDVPQTYAKNKALGKWVGKQRLVIL